jgi:hypothetical protein
MSDNKCPNLGQKNIGMIATSSNLSESVLASD